MFKDLNSDGLILKLIDEILRPKYSNLTFYCHNLGGYDAVFILKALLSYNEVNKDVYKISTVLRLNNIIKLVISKEVNGVKHTVTILDSYAILTTGLDKLAKSFGLGIRKGSFPYKFSIKENLFYEGSNPDISMYNNITPEMYIESKVEMFNFKESSIKYLELDINIWFEIWVKSNQQIFLDYNINMQDSITISGLAMKLFIHDYYDNNIPRIDTSSVYHDIKLAHYGGITEVYKPYGENLNYYDVNSLYPFASLEDMPGLVCDKCYYHYSQQLTDDMFGFYECYI